MFKSLFLSLFLLTALSIFAAPLKVAANVSSVTFTTAQVTGGTEVRGAITLASNAPIGGLKVALSSNNPAASFAPISVSEPGGATINITVPAGKNSASFAVKTTAVAQDTPITITAGVKESSQSGTFTIIPPILKSVTLASPNVVGGQTSTARVVLSGPAPSGGAAISLSSSNSKATVPARVAVAAGQSSASFDIRTVKVTGNDEQITIEATSATGAKVSAPLTVTLPLVPEIVSLTMADSNVIATGRVRLDYTLDRTVTSFLTFSVTSSNPAVIPRVSTQVSSGQNSGLASLETKQVTADTNVTLTITSGNSTKSVNVTVRPFRVTVTLASSNVTGGTSVIGTITTNTERIFDPTVIALTSSDLSVIVPASVTIPANQTTATFEAFTQPVASNKRVTLTAKLPTEIGGESAAQFSIFPVTIDSLTLSTPLCNFRDSSCIGNLSGSITLTAPAPPGGMSFSLSTDSSVATVPNIILIPSGQTTSQFRITPNSTQQSGRVKITAVAGSGSQKIAFIELERTIIEVESVSLDAAETEGDKQVIGTVSVKQFRLVGSQRTADLTTTSDTSVRLQNNEVGISAPRIPSRFLQSSILIPRGQSTGNFTFIPGPVDSEKSYTLTASIDGAGRVSPPLTVKPATIQSLTLSETSVQGGQEVTATLQMSGPTQFSVGLTSSNSSAVTLIGSGVSGGNNSFTYTIVTSPTVTSTTPVTITAAFAGQTKTAELTVNKLSQLNSISFPATRIFSRLPTKVTVELDGPAPNGGANISLRSSNAQLIPLFTTTPRTIPAGQSSTTFDVEVTGGEGEVTVSAFYIPIRNQPSPSKTFRLTVERLSLNACNNGSSQSAVGGTTISCTLTILNNGMVAPEGGIQFSVESNNPSVLSAPSTFTIPAGENSATIQFNTQSVTQNTNVEVRYSIPGSGFAPSKFTITPQ